MSGGKKVLIFIVAYNAEKTISSVLQRIPVDRLPAGTDVLIIDDQSNDRTFHKAIGAEPLLKGLNLTVLYNPVNQGYGGNQKLGYQYAIQKGYDVVALLHGDGQYAPEMLPDLIAPVLKGEADACFGSRMMEKGAALRKGMPLYKYIGNKILTFVQNRMLKMGLSEFHSGYRVYSVKALDSLPFKYNTNDFHFDTEIIIQYKMRGLSIKEMPIPTYYGDEICYVNGMKYALDVVKTTLSSKIHGMGLIYLRKYDVGAHDDLYDIKTGYRSSHTMAVQKVKEGSRVLDVGCGKGKVADLLAEKKCIVTGIDVGDVGTNRMARYIKHDLDDGTLPAGLEKYDYILMLDCLEHFSRPERLLAELRERCYAADTRVIVTAPNIGFLVSRVGLLMGQFNYGLRGILDLGHKRLYTFRSLRVMLEQEGYIVDLVTGVPAPFPKALGKGLISGFLLGLNQALIYLWKRMFSYQIYIEAHMVPPLNKLLGKAVDKTIALSKESGM